LSLPELPEKKLARLVKECELNQKLARHILTSEYCDLFEAIMKETEVSATAVAVFLTETLKALKRDKINVDAISEAQIKETFSRVSSGELMKESLADVAVWLSKNENRSVQEAIDALGLKTVSNEELNMLVEKVIRENHDVIRERGEGSFGVLMGMIMKDLRGKADVAQVSRVLRERMQEALK
jgi:Glu-tRNA(Gln) amidotransferase subunit E-like FAD-binding protein